MPKTSQTRALEKHRCKLRETGLSRYEVRGLEADKALVRDLARRLALNDDAANELRSEVTKKIGGKRARRGGILAALRRSPLVGAELVIERENTSGRSVDL